MKQNVTKEVVTLTSGLSVDLFWVPETGHWGRAVRWSILIFHVDNIKLVVQQPENLHVSVTRAAGFWCSKAIMMLM